MAKTKADSATCMGWEKLPHEVDAKTLVQVGERTLLCPECHTRFQNDPQRESYQKFL